MNFLIIYIQIVLLLLEIKEILVFSPAAPTLVDPGQHTVEDGKTFALWLNNLTKIDRTNFKYFNRHLLFRQLLTCFEPVSLEKNIFANGDNYLTCSSGKKCVTINHKGELFACHNAGLPDYLPGYPEQTFLSMTTKDVNNDLNLIGRRNGITQFHTSLVSRFHFYETELLALCAANQVEKIFLSDYDLKLLLFYAICGLWCPIACSFETSNIFLMPTSYFKLLGNGAIESLIKYYNYEINQGVIKPWKNLN